MDPNKPPTDAPKFEFAVSTPAHGVCDVPGVRRLLCPPQARKFYPPKCQTNQNPTISAVPLRFFGRAIRMDIEIFGCDQKQRPRQNYGLNI